MFGCCPINALEDCIVQVSSPSVQVQELSLHVLIARCTILG